MKPKELLLISLTIPADMVAEAKEYRSKLIEEIATYDENLLDKYMEDRKLITEEEINNALRAATIDMAIIPMICGSSFKNKGVQFMLDAVCKYLPSPLDKEGIEGIHPDDTDLLKKIKRKFCVVLIQRAVCCFSI
jgi:elongation factor G